MTHIPRLNHVSCMRGNAVHQMAYWEWGDTHNPNVLVCVHGLTRQGRDFDALAKHLLTDYKVVCPDVFGRGQSDWLPLAHDYQVPSYVADMVTLIAHLNVAKVDWVGTSMGGLIGLGLAALPQNMIKRLVLNDVGPQIDESGLARIANYAGQPTRFRTVEEGAQALWSVSRSFGVTDWATWLSLSRPMLKPSNNEWVLHYDPKIAQDFGSHLVPGFMQTMQAMLWKIYDGLTCKTLVIRGQESDLLTLNTAQAMTQRGPKAQLYEVKQVGHAPMLNTPEQIKVIVDFLNAAP
jgi:pimeloyl-ACP methyl ester carboxylesterase